LLNLIHCVISWFNFLISPVNFRVLYSAIVGLPEYGMNNGPHEEFYANTVVMNILKVMLVTLQILHIFWTILIIKTAVFIPYSERPTMAEYKTLKLTGEIRKLNHEITQ
jgi:hypothetical protein